MAEAILEHPTPVVSADQKPYIGQVWGEPMSDGRWQGWIVFVPVADGQVRRTDRETTQSTRAALEYWATSVTLVYLEGALARSSPANASAA
jgi:hypothetical protein